MKILERQEGVNFEKPKNYNRTAFGILARMNIVSRLHWQKKVGPCKQDAYSLRRLFSAT